MMEIVVSRSWSALVRRHCHLSS